jgi:UDP:flavonoid glycosyltransferase YjiC (YdhE family)
VPLIVLARAARRADPTITTALLLPRRFHHFRAAAGVAVLDVDHQNVLRTELEGYAQFAPDLVVDDYSPSTYFATQIHGIPRVTIQRSGSFAGAPPRRPGDRHSLSLDTMKLPDVSALGLPQPASPYDMFAAAVHVIPAIPEIETLPDALAADPSYVYSGPLTPADEVAERLWSAAEPDAPRRAIDAFLERCGARPIVFITIGTEAAVQRELAPSLHACIARLLDLGLGVITTVPVPPLTEAQRRLHHYSPMLPMHHVCERVHLIVHHCGNSTYHYAILHAVPALTVGTGCFDRDDIGVRLQELGVARHLPLPEGSAFPHTFVTTIVSMLQDGEWLRAATDRCAQLTREILRTSAAFRIESVLHHAGRQPVSGSPALRPRQSGPGGCAGSSGQPR